MEGFAACFKDLQCPVGRQSRWRTLQATGPADLLSAGRGRAVGGDAQAGEGHVEAGGELAALSGVPCLPQLAQDLPRLVQFLAGGGAGARGQL